VWGEFRRALAPPAAVSEKMPPDFMPVENWRAAVSFTFFS